jgi:sugar/nucleoside kinase (ribokinase family)
MNEAETVAFSGSLSAATDLDEDDIHDLIRSLTESGPFPIIVVKRGPRGALVFAGGMRFDSPARAVSARDETGAGDTFAAGFLAAWIKDRPITTCAALGNRIAREAVSVPGTRIDPARVARLAKAISR